jgi:hypothetical protein
MKIIRRSMMANYYSNIDIFISRIDNLINDCFSKSNKKAIGKIIELIDTEIIRTGFVRCDATDEDIQKSMACIQDLTNLKIDLQDEKEKLQAINVLRKRAYDLSMDV